MTQDLFESGLLSCGQRHLLREKAVRLLPSNVPLFVSLHTAQETTLVTCASAVSDRKGRNAPLTLKQAVKLPPPRPKTRATSVEGAAWA